MQEPCIYLSLSLYLVSETISNAPASSPLPPRGKSHGWRQVCAHRYSYHLHPPTCLCLNPAMEPLKFVPCRTGGQCHSIMATRKNGRHMHLEVNAARLVPSKQHVLQLLCPAHGCHPFRLGPLADDWWLPGRAARLHSWAAARFVHLQPQVLSLPRSDFRDRPIHPIPSQHNFWDFFWSA